MGVAVRGSEGIWAEERVGREIDGWVAYFIFFGRTDFEKGGEGGGVSFDARERRSVVDWIGLGLYDGKTKTPAIFICMAPLGGRRKRSHIVVHTPGVQVSK